MKKVENKEKKNQKEKDKKKQEDKERKKKEDKKNKNKKNKKKSNINLTIYLLLSDEQSSKNLIRIHGIFWYLDSAATEHMCVHRY